ncbi:MAG: [CysO sulfur-carrier protein]-S-L-cysteine hydrolase [Solirubrobacteraceae bacterium]|nr:[CysO sulfur-carrier protein]-S-L-cysteine hydrolase [Solirubrobacteraceae bacterium]
MSRRLVDELVAHALEDAPDECCGLISSRDGEGVAVHRVTNARRSPFAFEMDGKEQYQAQMAIEDDGLELGGLYHSHTRSAPEPSQTDINLAKWWPDPVWVIIGVEDRDAPIVRGWRIVDGAVTEAELELG